MGLADIIKSHRRIMLDTAPIIHFIEEHQIFSNLTNVIFSLIKSNLNIQAFSSVITLTEVLTQPMRKSRSDIVDKYKQFLLHSMNFIIYPIDTIVAEKAAQLRSQYGIKTPDALQIAVGIENSGTLFITNDQQLKKIEGIEILVLGDFLIT